MKTIRIFGIRGLTLILGAALGVSVGFTSPAFAQTFSPTAVIVNPDGKVTYLGTLDGGNTRASGINDSGQVVGYSDTADGAFHAFITGPNGMGMTDLGTLRGEEVAYSKATAINAAGQVVGTSEAADYPYRAFITGPNGMGMRDLGTTLGDSEVRADGINAAGQVVGTSGSFESTFRAFITGPNGMGMRDLGTLGGGSSTARGINDAGR